MIQFTSDFISGNGKLIRYEHHSDKEKIIFIAEQKFNEPKPIWFYFQVNGFTEEKVIFEIANAEQFLVDGDVSEFTGDAPVYRSLDGEWMRTGKCVVEYEEDGFPRVFFTIEKCPKNVQVAFCYPYTPENLEETMRAVQGFEKKVIGYSTKGRPIVRYATEGGRPSDKPGLYFTCRQHAGEVGGAWVLDGILRYFGSDEGKNYRERMAIWAVPMVDIDGVTEGAYGKDQAIGDMNRAWTPAFQKRTEVSCVVEDMKRWQKACKSVAVADVHSPAHEVLGMLVNIRTVTSPHIKGYLENTIECLNEEIGNCGMEKFFPNYFSPINSGSSQGVENTQYLYCTELLKLPAYIFEVSYQGAKDGRLFSKQDYLKYGEIIAKTLAKKILEE